MKAFLRGILVVCSLLLLYLPRSAAQEWAPITDAEKNMTTNALDPGAGAIVLFKHGEMNIQENNGQFWSIGYTTYTRIKILNDAGRESANVSMLSSSDVRLSKVEGRTILPSGEIIPLDSSKVFRGTAVAAGRNFAELKTSFTFPNVQPGAIIEYQVTENEDGFFPSSWVFDTYGLGTLQSTLKVSVAKRLVLKAFPLGTTLSRISTSGTPTAAGYEFDFSTQNLRPIKDEPFAIPERDQAAMVMFTPVQQAFGNGVYPVIQTWDDVAGGYSRGFENIDKVDTETSKKAKELTGSVPEGRPRAEALYKYIQQNIVSSNLASITLERNVDTILAAKRGDPYELNALYLVMLKHAKVDANLVLIGGRDFQTIVKAFPNYDQFRRMIIRINLKDGPIFADAAATGTPFGELPWYEKGLTAMVAKGTKMQEMDIPLGAPEDNVSTTKINFQVTPDWQAKGDAEIDLKGAEADEFRRQYMELSPTKVEENLTEYFAYGKSDGEVSNITHPDFHDAAQPLVLKAQVQDRIVDQGGPGQVLLNPWMTDNYRSQVFKVSERHSGIRFRSTEQRVSTSVWQLPPQTKVMQLPKDEKFDSDIGSFAHSCTQNANTVTCTRTFVLKKPDLPGIVDYVNLKRFFDEIIKDDQEVMVLQAQ